MANGHDTSPAQSAGARMQVRASLRRNPAFSRLSDAQRQAAAETWMINFVYQQGAYVNALRSGDKVMQGRLSDAAVTRFQKEVHINLRALDLTDRGFLPKG